MKKQLLTAVALTGSMLCAQAAQATFIGDTVEVTASSSLYGTYITGSATVGTGTEFTGTETRFDYLTFEVDLAASTITYTASKPFSAGNFTGVLDVLSISNIDYQVLGVAVNSASSACSLGSISTSFTDTSVTIGGCFLNTPSTALSHSLIFDVTFGDLNPVQSVSEPAGFSLLALGTLGAALLRRRRTGTTGNSML